MKSKYLMILVTFFSLSIPCLFLLLTTTASPPPFSTPDLRIRPGYTSYESYIQRQLNKTLNPKLRKIWTTRDWDRKIQVFAAIFDDLKRRGLLSNSSRALCVGARMGQEVEALRRVGVSDSVGVDLVPSPPLVVRGDFEER
ncbi:hypothetical protein SASPL_110983 [Salvia splendens]|uniref:Uncharacterized protein n=1 Tax=Salvia splendens TaxID=180675 RepID=A0A8X8Y5L6_SALSN|nr:uncharacterized protein LOC121800631 [Salvia splendens]KAG6426750.1 hypothetical protein SASPL_110983 [Salvia splendens]